MRRRDGGPAFPGLTTDSGLSLRDYFAAVEQSTYRHSPRGPLGTLWSWLWWGEPVDDEEMAEACYEAADAMLRERDR